MSVDDRITLSTREQVALIETIGLPLENVVGGTVQAGGYPNDESKIVIVWQGVAVIPRVQFDAVRGAVEIERVAAEAAAPPAYAETDHTKHVMCDPTLGCIERNDQ